MNNLLLSNSLDIFYTCVVRNKIYYYITHMIYTITHAITNKNAFDIKKLSFGDNNIKSGDIIF